MMKFMICVPRQILFGCSQKANTRDGACGTYRGEKCVRNFGGKSWGK